MSHFGRGRAAVVCALGSTALVMSLAHCVGDAPSDASGDADSGDATADGSTSDGATDGGAQDSGPNVTCPPTTGLAPGVFDTAYNGTAAPISITNFVPLAATIDSQDRVLVAGVGDCSADRSMTVARYNADGSTDTSFGAGGSTCAHFSTGASEANAVVVDSSGDIYLVGGATGGYGVARLADNGTLDTVKFASPNGYFQGTPPNSNALSGAVHGGKLYVGGQANGNSGTVKRITGAGALDTGFGFAGTLLATSFTGVAVNDAGVVAGVGANTSGFLVVDRADDFGIDAGVVTGNVPMFTLTTNVLAVDTGALVGTKDNNGQLGMGLLGSDGYVTTFGDGGFVHAPITITAPGFLKTSVAKQCDGKIVMVGGGGDGDGGMGPIRLARFGANGLVDSSFGSSGIASLPKNTDASPIAVLATSTGYLVVVSSELIGASDNVHLTRFSQ